MIHIIGGSGFVGSRLASLLSASNIDFRTFDKCLSGEGYVDVTQPDTLAMLPAASTVINLAAEHRDDVTPVSLYDLVNVRGARNVCEHCSKVGVNRIVFTSSVAVKLLYSTFITTFVPLVSYLTTPPVVPSLFKNVPSYMYAVPLPPYPIRRLPMSDSGTTPGSLPIPAKAVAEVPGEVLLKEVTEVPLII